MDISMKCNYPVVRIYDLKTHHFVRDSAYIQMAHSDSAYIQMAHSDSENKDTALNK
jgi:hypothetical protein